MLILEKLPLEKAFILQNLYPCYLHDLSEFIDVFPNQFGLFESEEISSYDKETFLKEWWQHPDEEFPFLIRVEDRPAGFALVISKPYSGNTDHEIMEFFMLKPYRKHGLAELAVNQVFERFHGSWKIKALPRNLPGRGFWTQVIGKYTHTNYHEGTDQTDQGEMIVYRFSN